MPYPQRLLASSTAAPQHARSRPRHARSRPRPPQYWHRECLTPEHACYAMAPMLSPPARPPPRTLGYGTAFSQYRTLPLQRCQGEDCVPAATGCQALFVGRRVTCPEGASPAPRAPSDKAERAPPAHRPAHAPWPRPQPAGACILRRCAAAPSAAAAGAARSLAPLFKPPLCRAAVRAAALAGQGHAARARGVPRCVALLGAFGRRGRFGTAGVARLRRAEERTDFI